MPYGSTLHIPPINLLPLAAKQESYNKAYLLTKNIEEFSGKKFKRKDQQAEKDKIERVTGLGRRTREEIAKWNQMTALRFPTGGRHQTPPGLPPGDCRGKCFAEHSSISVDKPNKIMNKNNLVGDRSYAQP